MAITHTNRRGQVYYLHATKVKSGKSRWFMSTKSDGELADAIPAGYELYEKPEDGQVFIRKIPPKIISDAEVALVRELARSKAQTRYTIVEAKGKAVIVYAADDNLGAWSDIMSDFSRRNPETFRAVMEEQLRYNPMFRFSLMDEKSRIFHAERWCFLGSIDDWFHLDSGSLRELTMKYIPHLGSESFFELM